MKNVTSSLLNSSILVNLYPDEVNQKGRFEKTCPPSEATRPSIFPAASCENSAHWANPGRAYAKFDVRFEFRAEMVKHILIGVPAVWPSPQLESSMPLHNHSIGRVFHRSTPMRNIGQYFPGLIGADPARNALSAAFLLEEAGEDANRVNNTVRVVADQQCTGSKQRQPYEKSQSPSGCPAEKRE